MKKPTAFLYHPVFIEHDTGPGHPECPARLEAIIGALEEAGLPEKCLRPEFAEASVESVTRIHAPEYVRHIADQSGRGRHFYEGLDTIGSAATYRAALLAAGAVQSAVDAVMNGEAANAFCAVRPPGHHAEREQAMGFCFFNNVAIAVRYLQDRHGVERVGIIDWDVHHGNGTQHAFYEDLSVFYFSTHQYPHYPGTGRRDETGAKAGKGFTLNVPMAAGSTDTDYLRVFKETLRPAMEKFRPEFILISAGFDPHEADPLAGMQVTTGGFEAMTREAVGMARDLCGGRLVSVLEGGYDLPALALSVTAHLKVLME